GAVCARRRGTEKQRGVFVPQQAVVDRISKTALDANFAGEPGGERAAAENVVDDVGGEEIRIVARDTDAAEIDHGLRHVEVDIDALPERLRRSRLIRNQLRLGR